jgi:hypothetical protein
MGNGKYPHLKIQRFGSQAIGVRLEGNPKKPEPQHFRVYLPFGDVDITRTTDDEYWVHIRRNEPSDVDVIRFKAVEGEFKDARKILATSEIPPCITWP